MSPSAKNAIRALGLSVEAIPHFTLYNIIYYVKIVLRDLILIIKKLFDQVILNLNTQLVHIIYLINRLFGRYRFLKIFKNRRAVEKFEYKLYNLNIKNHKVYKYIYSSKYSRKVKLSIEKIRRCCQLANLIGQSATSRDFL